MTQKRWVHHAGESVENWWSTNPRWHTPFRHKLFLSFPAHTAPANPLAEPILTSNRALQALAQPCISQCGCTNQNPSKSFYQFPYMFQIRNGCIAQQLLERLTFFPTNVVANVHQHTAPYPGVSSSLKTKYWCFLALGKGPCSTSHPSNLFELPTERGSLHFLDSFEIPWPSHQSPQTKASSPFLCLSRCVTIGLTHKSNPTLFSVLSLRPLFL